MSTTTTPTPARPCKLGRLLGSTHHTSPADRQLMRGWLASGTDHRGRALSAVTLAAALTAEGHSVGPTTLKDHRGRRCVCWRDTTEEGATP